MNELIENSEIVIGLVAPIGIDTQKVTELIKDYLNQYNYSLRALRLSEGIEKADGRSTELIKTPESDRINSYMDAGNELRKLTGYNHIVASIAVSDIYNSRTQDQPLSRTAHLLNSLKHPDEVHQLRTIYGEGFFLLGLTSSREEKLHYLIDRKNISDDDANALIKRDESEDNPFGQKVRDVFHLADCFINMDEPDIEAQLERFLELIFSNPYITPTQDEYSMFLAFASAIRSVDLSRQIGAVIRSEHGEIIATGANDVPRFGGGLYWSDNDNDDRDYKRGFDSNEKRRDEILLDIMKKFNPDKTNNAVLIEEGKELLKDTGLLDITEYGRAVHAEMEALMSCLRSGVSPRNGTLYGTTFPCHNCAKHIIASGIKRVVFVEPYPKSQALALHDDAISYKHDESSGQREPNKVLFEPFVGLGPRRFIDLFSLSFGSGTKLKRKKQGAVIPREKSKALVRVPMLPVSYIDREIHLVLKLKELGEKNGTDDGSARE